MKQFNYVTIKAILFDKMGMRILYETTMMSQKIICSQGIHKELTKRILPLLYI